VVTEWWRGRTDVRGRILDVVNVEPLSLAVAKSAGLAMTRVPRSTAVDAIVMAFAAGLRALSIANRSPPRSNGFVPAAPPSGAELYCLAKFSHRPR
jgi:hypothetical protein